ncbi:CaiB/BaiF CoA transferase family protein [Ferrovibrio sp.]|uniref:CaiB/BaiF CoA transferase family protein n=1 Tax=Ferrovibrio sp. TaxID=1917215 RepID=UPI003D12653A
MTTALSGVRVLDLSRVLAGPFVAQTLADLGADVIKVERPVSGDESRAHGVRPSANLGLNKEDSSGFTAVNRGKRSIALNLARSEGQEIARRLACQCDVIIENFKTGDLQRYGLDYKTLSALNPSLIYCSITGFGQTGPYASFPGYDLIFQAMSGLMAVTGGPDGEPGGGPQRVGYSVADANAGLYAVIGILAALYHRTAHDGRGQHIDIALVEAQIAAMTVVASGFQITGKVPPRAGNISPISCPYQPFKCADGMLVVTVNNERQFKNLCQVLGFPDVALDPRFATNALRVQHKDVLLPLVSEAMLKIPVNECRRLLLEAGVPCGPVNDLGQAFADEQIRYREIWKEVNHPEKGRTPIIASPLRLSETPVEYRLAPPSLGEHTALVLTDILNMDPNEISSLADRGIVGLANQERQGRVP